jgi:7,8-dihydropterin-6-yl-methyl-4-(beta-D-ribofuranosyl)aminobenzene 5'-phosphate synthase
MAKFDTVFYTGHCTGQAQFEVLKTILGERLHALSTGAVAEI